MRSHACVVAGFLFFRRLDDVATIGQVLALRATVGVPQTVTDASNLAVTPTTGVDYLGLVLAKHEAEHFGSIAFRDLAPHRQPMDPEDQLP